MSILFCAACNTQIEIDDDKIGRSMRCPNCKNVFAVHRVLPSTPAVTPSWLIVASVAIVAVAVGLGAGFIGGDRYQRNRSGHFEIDAKDAQARATTAIGERDTALVKFATATAALSEREQQSVRDSAVAQQSASQAKQAREQLLAEQRRGDDLNKRLADAAQETLIFRLQFGANGFRPPLAQNLVILGVVDRLLAVQDIPQFVDIIFSNRTLAEAVWSLDIMSAEMPENDHIRAGLGVARFLRSVERFGQTMYRLGLKPDNRHLPLLRFPLPENPKPIAVRAAHLRHAFETFALDLAAAESVLAGIRDDNIKLPLQLAQVRFDFDSDGKPDRTLVELFQTLLRQGNFEFLKGNPGFRVCFDRGDVAWLRAYCHLLSSFADFYLAFDLEPAFRSISHDLFAKPAEPQEGTLDNCLLNLTIKHPARLGSFRRHLVAVCQLNRETWKFIRAETDDDQEWLPNSKQKGAIGLPITGQRIGEWLVMVDELEDLLEGRKVIGGKLFEFLIPNIPPNMGLNIRKLLDDPPSKFDWRALRENGIDPKYLDRGREMNLFNLGPLLGILDDPLSVAYAAWFN